MNWIEQRIRRAEQGDTELDLSVDPWNAGARDKFSEFPASILGLKHLTKLDLSGHDIKVLPIGFSKLESLRELSLRQNKGLRLQNGRELPSQLTHLDLSFLEQLGDIRFERLASLRSLTLAYSGLERFPAGILSLSRLENLRLQGCPLRSLPTTFSRLQNLRTFSIGGEGVNLSLADISVITELQCLQELALIDFDSVEELEIAALRDLSRLQLLDCPLDAIPSSWREFRRLRELRLTLPDTKIARPIAKLEEVLSFNQLWVLHL